MRYDERQHLIAYTSISYTTNIPEIAKLFLLGKSFSASTVTQNMPYLKISVHYIHLSNLAK